MTPTCFGDLGGVRGCWGYKLKLVRNQAENKDIFNDVRLFSLKSLQKATNNFSTKLGIGGFSSTYKGSLENGTVVAVEVLGNGSRNPDFESLIKIMSRIRHRNVVEFIGCCVEGDQRIAVYEFVGEQSLEQLLFDSNSKNLELTWHRRASICLGVARGLEYLHHGISRRVVHRDIKPSSVLLDDNYNPKIGNFVLAHLFDDDASHYSGPVCGTFGYIDPEYLTRGTCTEKADVYAFGVLLLGVISGRTVVQFSTDHWGMNLAGWVQEKRDCERVLELVDPKLTEFPKDEVIRFVDIALFCIQGSQDLRPSMSEVLLMLSGGYDFNKKVPRKPELPILDQKSGEMEMSAQDYDDVSLMLSGGYDFNKKVPRKPELPILDQKSGEIEMSAQGDDNVSCIDTRQKASLPAFRSLERAPSRPVANTKGKMIHRYKTEIESDPEAEADSEAELMQTPLDLEIELYTSIESRMPGAVSEPRPSDDTLVKPELRSTSSESNALVQKGRLEVIEQMSQGLQGGLKSLTERNMCVTFSISGLSPETSRETSASPEMITTTSTQNQTFMQSEVIDGLPFQAEAGQQNKILLLPKVDTNRPIRSTLDKISEALGDAQSKRICLHGRGGSGKTNVLKTLFHYPPSFAFDHVIFVTMPRLPHQRNIQNEIMQQLSLNIRGFYSDDERAALICEALRRKKVLLLLDDVWEIINLHEVGIPDPGPDNSCWLVLATRSLDVCHAMADRKIEMEALSKEEAWGLFCEQVSNVVDSPEIKPYAQAIVDECHGLPLIISAVSRVLKFKSSVTEWKFALWSFQIPDTHNTDNLYSLSPQIKYCYHRLKGHDVKNCFLYSALFPRDKEIDISMLVDCFIAEGLLGVRTIAAYKRGHDIVEQLVNASLLEAIGNGGKVRMHNVIQDSALAILSSDLKGYQVLTRYYLTPSFVPSSALDGVKSMKEGNARAKLIDSPGRSNMPSLNVCKYLTGAGAQLKEPPALEEWTQAEMIFLMDNELSSLPSNPSCPNLQALFLQRNSCLRVIPASFFDGMCVLRILNLSKTRIKSLPDSFLKLKNLEVLSLRDCERLLVLPPSIGLLKALQVLDLEGTELTHLPDTVGELTSLTHLRVSFYGSLNRNKFKDLPEKLIPDKMISNLDLRELGMFVQPGDRRWTSCASKIVEEISNLKLFSFYFHFPELDHLEHFLNKNQSWTNGDLTVFNFIVGHDFKHVVSQVSYDAEMMYSSAVRCLRFVNGENIPLAVLVVLSCVTSFYLDHHLNICSLSDFGFEVMHFLKVCILRDCPKLQAIVDKGCTTLILPSLEYLSINCLWNLERIWVANLQMGSLAKLRYLSLHACPKLKFVLTCSMLDILTNLEELVIEDSASLEYIVIDDKVGIGDDASNEFVDTSGVSGNSAGARSPILRSLKVLKLHYLPELSGIWKGRWPSLEYMSFCNCPKLKNLHLLANDAMNIKEIAADKDWWNSLDWDDLVMSRRLQEFVTPIDVDNL